MSHAAMRAGHLPVAPVTTVTARIMSGYPGKWVTLDSSPRGTGGTVET